MDIENMKNMLVLKGLPSNIVDEAIIILKPNIKIKSLDTIDNNNKSKKLETENSKKYIINEAEMLVSNYISKIENDKNEKMRVNKKIENKCKKLKIISLFLGIMLLASFCVR